MKEDYKETIKKIIRYIKKYWFYVGASLLFAGVTVILTLYLPILIGDGIDLLLGKGAVSMIRLYSVLEKMGLVIVATAVSQWLMNLCNNKIAYHVVKDIRTKAFNQLEKLPISYIDSHQYGDVISRIILDIDQFSEGLLLGFSQLFVGVLTIIGTLLFMIWIQYKIALVVIIITPVSFFVAGFIAKKTFVMFKKQSETKGQMTSFIEEIVGNQKIVRAFSYEEETIKQFIKINQDLQEQSLKVTFFSSLTNPSTRFINGIVYAGVGIVGAIFAMAGFLTVGQLVCFLSYANQYTKPFNEISSVITEMQNALACATRVFELIEETPMPTEPETAVTLTEANGSVALVQASFSYQKDKTLLKDLNLEIKPGQRVAIVGPTGCGKSTLINLLMRFYELDSGEIRIDHKNIQEFTKASLRKNFGMVLQETWLKAGTVKDNIAYGRPEATMEEIMQAAKDAHAHSFIKRLPKGYDTLLTEDGGNLSQGQKQLLCIARVMLCLPPMLILDEATSSIDTRTELKVQEAFAKLMNGRTSFIVAHRLSTIKEADIILVMKDGQIVEQGTHEMLLEKKGFYEHMYQSQFTL